MPTQSHRQEYREQINERQREWLKENPEKSKQYRRDYRKRYPEKAGEQSRKYRLKCRGECIAHYSNGKNVCDCCGEFHVEFLGIDHINGGGNEARRQRGHGNIYQWLRARKYPNGYRVLCHNCNMSIGFYGYCPHQIESEE